MRRPCADGAARWKEREYRGAIGDAWVRRGGGQSMGKQTRQACCQAHAHAAGGWVGSGSRACSGSCDWQTGAARGAGGAGAQPDIYTARLDSDPTQRPLARIPIYRPLRPLDSRVTTSSESERLSRASRTYAQRGEVVSPDDSGSSESFVRSTPIDARRRDSLGRGLSARSLACRGRRRSTRCCRGPDSSAPRFLLHTDVQHVPELRSAATQKAPPSTPTRSDRSSHLGRGRRLSTTMTTWTTTTTWKPPRRLEPPTPT